MGGLCSLDRSSIGSRPRLHDLDLSSLTTFFSKMFICFSIEHHKTIYFLWRFGCRIMSIGFVTSIFVCSLLSILRILVFLTSFLIQLCYEDVEIIYFLLSGHNLTLGESWKACELWLQEILNKYFVTNTRDPLLLKQYFTNSAYIID